MLLCDGEGIGIAVFPDHAGELPGPGDIGAFADIDKVRFRSDDEGFQAAEHGVRRDLRDVPGCYAFDPFGHSADMVGGSSAATADDIDEAAVGKVADIALHLLGSLVVFPEFVGQAGIGIGGDIAVGNFR